MISGFTAMLSLRVMAAMILLGGMVASGADDRALAEWVLHAGGSVTLDGGSPVRDVADLPSGPVRLRAVDVVSIMIAPTDFKRLSAAPHLRELYLSGRTWHSLPTDVSVASFAHLAGMTALEKLVLSL